MTLPLSVMEAIVIGWVFVSLVMFLLWLVQRVTGDAGIVDLGWSALLGALALFYAAVLDGAMPRRWIVGVLAALWSFRLAYYLLVDRVLGKEEDGRYQKLRETRGSSVQKFFFFFFQAQGVLDVLLSMSFLAAIRNDRPGLDVVDYLAIAVWCLAVVGESIADRQLRRFRQDPGNRGKVCRVGLWRYSRHPNYFFEWIHWWAYVLFAAGSAGWWLTLLVPALMLFLILKVTGIPPTEARALESRGDAYCEYQESTSAFVPWFPMKEQT